MLQQTRTCLALELNEERRIANGQEYAEQILTQRLKNEDDSEIIGTRQTNESAEDNRIFSSMRILFE